jgi:hypothetical protein
MHVFGIAQVSAFNFTVTFPKKDSRSKNFLWENDREELVGLPPVCMCMFASVSHVSADARTCIGVCLFQICEVLEDVLNAGNAGETVEPLNQAVTVKDMEGRQVMDCEGTGLVLQIIKSNFSLHFS